MLKHLKKAVFTLAILFPFAASAQMMVKELADGVYTLSENHYISLVVVGDDGVLVTDPAYPQRAESMKTAIAGITDKAVTRVVLSHEHYDHVGGTEVFPDADIVCHQSCRAVFELDVLGIAPNKVDVTFDDFLSFDFGGKTVHLHNYGPADGFASTVVFLPEERIAFTADLYAHRALTSAMWMDDDNYLAILRVLRELKNKDLRHAVNSHSDSTSVQDVEENIAFVEDLYNLVLGEMQKAMQSGGPAAVVQSLERWKTELKLPQYADWKGYEENLPAHISRMALSIFHGG